MQPDADETCPEPLAARDVRWVIVAHPDDEMIFAGGAMLRGRNARWKVVIATHDEASPRAAEALDARDRLRAAGVEVDYLFLDHADRRQDPLGGLDEPRLLAQMASLGVAAGERVYTHGPGGEYGHVAHRALNGLVARALGGVARLSAFSGDGAVVERIADPVILGQKRAIFDAAYPSQARVWKGLSDMMRQTMLEEERHYAP